MLGGDMKVGIMGGYGFNNVGDEAQLSACIKSLTDNGIEDIVVFTPNQEFTRKYHNVSTVDATRNAIYKENFLPFYNAIYPKFSLDYKSLLKSIMIAPMLFLGFMFVVNAILYKKIGVCFFNRAVIKNIFNLDCLHFSGGGYFTKDTFSRLLDFSFVMIVCRILDVQVRMSGQTLGMWDNRILKSFIRFSMKSVRSVSLRDVGKSKKYLEMLNLDMDISEICDDAYGIKIKESSFKESIVLHFHYWGRSSDKEYHEKIEKIYLSILNSLALKGYNCIMMSMTPTDDFGLSAFSQKYAVDFSSSNDSFDRKVCIYKSSLGVITMKHHPIIFGFIFNKPVLSFYDSPYYKQKNDGAFQSVSIPVHNYNLNDVDFLTMIKDFPYTFDEKYTSSIKEKIIHRDKWFSQNYANIYS